MKVLMTGGTGFVGRAAVQEVLAAGHTVRLAVRRSISEPASGVEMVLVGDIGGATEWVGALDGVDAVVHLAARAHVLREDAPDPEAAFLETNYAGTKRLAEACRGRVSQLVYLSSIGVHGAGSDRAFDESSALAPHSPYARSKALAEDCLQALVQRGELDCRILRPPLVYGPRAPGNLARLAGLVRRRLPLPLGSVRNRRSLVGVEHLARAIRAVVEAQSVSRSAYVIADREVVSTPEIVRAIAAGLDAPARLWPLPVAMLRAVGSLAGRRGTIEQLVGDLEVDARAFRAEFGDLQPASTLEGLGAAARESR